MRIQIGVWLFLLILFLFAIAAEFRRQRKVADSSETAAPMKPDRGASAAQEDQEP